LKDRPSYSNGSRCTDLSVDHGSLGCLLEGSHKAGRGTGRLDAMITLGLAVNRFCPPPVLVGVDHRVRVSVRYPFF